MSKGTIYVMAKDMHSCMCWDVESGRTKEGACVKYIAGINDIRGQRIPRSRTVFYKDWHLNPAYDAGFLLALSACLTDGEES